jgi:mRNA-degrading endonuclease RelE of RelBE toxin-antitoxin system
MHAVESTPEPYRVRFSAAAAQQAAALARPAKERLGRKLVQLADLAAFARAYSLNVEKIGSMVADSDGLEIRYEVNDTSFVLTVLEIANH